MVVYAFVSVAASFSLRAVAVAVYQRNVAILEAADGRRFLGYFVTADKFVCITIYCVNDKELDVMMTLNRPIDQFSPICDWV